jgi:toxin ParE1/3/4
MRPLWSAFARIDRAAIFDFIEADNPHAAASVDERIRRQIEGLEQFPEKGRIGRVAGTRELVIDRTPYIAVYSSVGNVIRILRILHGARIWPDDAVEKR